MTCRGVVFVCPHRLYSKRGGRLIAAPTGVIPFNRTGCIRDVAGGRLPMNECVIAPGNHWFLIRCAEHHPYGFADTFYLCAHCSYNAERCKALSVTCGDSSPKGRAKGAFSICFPSAPIVPTMRNAVPRLIHRLWRSPFPEGEGYGRNTIQPHKFYSLCPGNGTQAVPYGFAG